MYAISWSFFFMAELQNPAYRLQTTSFIPHNIKVKTFDHFNLTSSCVTLWHLRDKPHDNRNT